jgi:RNA polymerase sigma-70 factor, ECF subfamily
MTSDRQTTHDDTAPEADDLALIRQCQRGDDSAFDALYQRYRLPLFRYLHRILEEHADMVDDLFQQTWIKAVRSLPKYQHREKFLAWLCRIAHNLAMDYFRARKVEAPAELPLTLADQAPHPDTELSRQEFGMALEKAIQKLPPEQQEVIRLRNEGMPFKDIALKHHISLNTALGRMHYAVQNLKKLLAPFL